jgi:hypothetical protein
MLLREIKGFFPFYYAWQEIVFAAKASKLAQ